MKFHKDGTRPTGGEIFVFGSNLAGAHGAGAALAAREYYGAQLGVGVGMTGNSYAIPTKDTNIKTMPLESIRLFVDEFIKHARSIPRHEFFVTAIGCGLAGYTARDIAPMFHDAPDNCSFPEEWKRFLNAPIQALRLLDVAKANRESPHPDKFTMARHSHPCGTPACAFGNYAAREDLQTMFVLRPANNQYDGVYLRAAPEISGNVGEAITRKYFDLDDEEMDSLFGDRGCNTARTPNEAADYIERYVERVYGLTP